MSPARKRTVSRCIPGLLVLFVACVGPSVKTPKPVDEEFARLEAGARAAHSRGEYFYAVTLYESLLLEAERTDDPSKIGDSAYNLAVCHMALGNWERAGDLLAFAEYELQRAGDPLAQVFIARARLELFAGRAGACIEAAEQAITDQRSLAEDRELSAAHVLVGLGALALSAVEQAESALVAARHASRDDRARSSQLRLQAKIHEARRQPVEAAETFDREAQLDQLLSRYAPMAEALEFAGDSWQAADRLDLAQDRWLRAARARFAQAQRRGSTPENSLRGILAATELCARLGASGTSIANASLRTRLENLVQRIELERVRLQGIVDLVEAERQYQELGATVP